MRKSLTIRAAALGAALCLAGGARAAPCDGSLLSAIPARPADAPTGSAFARAVDTVDAAERERAIETQLDTGNLPGFLRRLAPIALTAETAGGRPVRVVVCVLPDYLSVGSDADFLLVPMRLATALRIGARYGFTLPTAKLVDAIYAQSAVRLAPRPLPASDQMRSTDYYAHHNDLIRQQRSSLGKLTDALLAGHKKDLVLTNRLWHALDRVAIYGWHKPDGQPIQTLSTVHGARYADYSHGARLVSTQIYVDGEPRSIYAALSDPELARALSSEGPLTEPRALVARLSLPPAEAAAPAPSALAHAAEPR